MLTGDIGIRDRMDLTSISYNGTVVLRRANLNFNNTSTVNVNVTSNGTMSANVSFDVNVSSLATVISDEQFTSTSNQSVFVLNNTLSPQSVNYVLVFRNGLEQTPTVHYTLSGQTLTFTSNTSLNDLIEIREFIGMNVANGGFAAGANQQIQFNKNGSLAGDANLTYAQGVSLNANVTTNVTQDLFVGGTTHGVQSYASSNPRFQWNATGQGANAKKCQFYLNAAGSPSFILSFLNDAEVFEEQILNVTRVANTTNVSSIALKGYTTITGISTDAKGGVTGLDVIVNNTGFGNTGSSMRIINGNASGQTPLDWFYNTSTLSGRIRNDFAGNMNYVAYGGNHVFWVGGDSGVGNGAFQVMSGAFTGPSNVLNDGSMQITGDLAHSTNQSSRKGLELGYYSGNINGQSGVLAQAFDRGNSAYIQMSLRGSSMVLSNATGGGLNTTANATNMYNDPTTGATLRSTSSIRYKTDVEDLWANVSSKIYSMRPVWYRSNTETTVDSNKVSYVGLIAEEVANLEPRLVHWITPDPSQPAIPDGVAYDRLTVLLIDVVKNQANTIIQLQSEIDLIKQRLIAANIA